MKDSMRKKGGEGRERSIVKPIVLSVVTKIERL